MNNSTASAVSIPGGRGTMQNPSAARISNAGPLTGIAHGANERSPALPIDKFGIDAMDKPDTRPLDAAQESWAAERCPICSAPKQARKHWFCIQCFNKLPTDARNILITASKSAGVYPKGWIVTWIKATALLKGQTT